MRLGARIGHQLSTKEEILERAWTNSNPIVGELLCARRTSWATPTYGGLREKGQKGNTWTSEVLGRRAAKRLQTNKDSLGPFHSSSNDERRMCQAGKALPPGAKKEYHSASFPVLRGHKGSQDSSFLCFFSLFEGLVLLYMCNASNVWSTARGTVATL